MGVGEPKVERDDGAFHEEAEHDEDERHDDQPVEAVGGQTATDRRQVQRTGARVQQGDAGQDHQRADAVGDGEVERSLQRSGFLGLVPGQPVRGHAHQLEVHEHVEQVAAEAETADGGEEHEQQRMEEHADGLEVVPREHERGGHQGRTDRRHAGTDRVDDEPDTEHDRAARWPVAEPVDDGLADRVPQEQQAQDRDGGRGPGRRAHRRSGAGPRRAARPAGRRRSAAPRPGAAPAC